MMMIIITIILMMIIIIIIIIIIIVVIISHMFMFAQQHNKPVENQTGPSTYPSFSYDDWKSETHNSVPFASSGVPCMARSTASQRVVIVDRVREEIQAKIDWNSAHRKWQRWVSRMKASNPARLQVNWENYSCLITHACTDLSVYWPCFCVFLSNGTYFDMSTLHSC